MDAIQNYFQEEAWYYSTLHDLEMLVLDYGDRVWADLEHNSPTVYESLCAYKANQEIAEFLSCKSKDDHNDYY